MTALRKHILAGVASGALGASCALGLAQGDHWSFETPVRPEVPSVGDEWRRTPIDSFVFARLEDDQLQPNAEADRRTLIRRLSLDLVGLPPEPAEVEAFVHDADPDAYANLVDRLLARPQFGERMALRWLDLARYADTNGYSIDGGRHMWAWRDWVIDAYNQNMPFDQFTVEQLAGDLIPGATTSQRTASGFNRNHMNTHEGGTIAEEYRVAYVVDRVNTTGVAWMGLTLGCAQCHDHKYDPISQREYYEFFAFFNTITDRGNDGDGGKNSVPFMPVYDAKQLDTLARLRADLEPREAELLGPDPDLDSAQVAWEERERNTDRAAPQLTAWNMAGPFESATADEAFATDFGPESGIDLSAVDSAGQLLWQARPDLTDGEPHALSGARSAWYFHRTMTSSLNSPVDVSFGSDDAIRVWFNGAIVVDQNVRRGVAPDQERVTLDLRAGENVLLMKVINDGGPAGMYFKLNRSGPDDLVMSAVQRAADVRSPEDRDVLLRYFRSMTPELEPLRDEIAGLKNDIAAIKNDPMTTVMVMEEMEQARESFVLRRGQYDQPRDRVAAGTPSFLPALPDDSPPNRMALAEWIVRDEHPLTARVAVNGLWQMLFGVGLVKTSEDFGTQGEAPSHPELLDFLAVEFVESGWDVKAMLRLMVTSAVYRQSSHASSEAIARDPENRLLARGPVFRLPAELIRDQALAVSGLLVDTIGGPSARPYQPDGLWREISHFGSTPATEQVYVQDSGDNLYRRSLYTIWKRAVPPPTMVAFDAPNRELCTPRRLRTNTPLQALVLLNERGFVEAARALAQRMMIEGGSSVEDRVTLGFTLVTARPPSPAELAVLRGMFQRELLRYRADPDAASALLSVGESPRDAELDPVKHAAWTIVASALLNLSETVTKS